MKVTHDIIPISKRSKKCRPISHDPYPSHNGLSMCIRLKNIFSFKALIGEKFSKYMILSDFSPERFGEEDRPEYQIWDYCITKISGSFRRGIPISEKAFKHKALDPEYADMLV